MKWIPFSAVLIVAFISVASAATPTSPSTPSTRPSKEVYLRLAGEVEKNLQIEILDKFFPVAADPRSGGFFENYGIDWKRGGGNNKSIVYQSRLTWTAAEAARRFPDQAPMYLAMTRRGAACLGEKLWDKNGGGFFWTVDSSGKPAGDIKQMYGHAFGIYALAASYRATSDPAALDLAKTAFQWLDQHAHDARNGGYFENIGPDGKPTNAGGSSVGARANQKSMNTSIHILEALAGLYEVWPDATVKDRMTEMLDICLNKIYSEPGYLTQFLSTDWQRASSPDSFGHDVEAGYLMIEAADLLGRGNDPQILTAARHLTDHALRYGWDKNRGGLYDSGAMNAQGAVTPNPRTDKIWWVEAEQLNALLLQHDHYGKETSAYWDAFIQQWNWITRFQIDHANGGWWPTVRADGTPASRIKADTWTECYHQARAMLNVSQRLRKLAGETPETTDAASDGVILPINGGFLKLQVRADNIIRVAYAKERGFFNHQSIVVVPPSETATPFTISTDAKGTTLSTAKLKAQINSATGAVSFLDASGKIILAEKNDGRTINPAQVMGEQTAHIRQQWMPYDDESFYGLGQHQQGLMDIKGYDLDLWQYNTNVVVPFLVSSRGYGILWDNASETRWGDIRPFQAIPAENLVDSSGKPGGLSAGIPDGGTDELKNPAVTPLIAVGNMALVGGQPLTPDAIAAMAIKSGGNGTSIPIHIWQGEVIAPVTGDYQFQTHANARIAVWIDNNPVIDHWRQYWLPAYELAKVHLEAGRHYPIKIRWGGDSGQIDRAFMSLTWKPPAPSADTSLWSNVGDGIDYYFVYGPDLDTVIAGNRRITGAATMLPQWAFGLWQSKDHYNSRKEILAALDGFRARHIPLDNIVQDWQYWQQQPVNTWGSHEFDARRFPDPVGMIQSIHNAHAHIMISAWGKFYEGTANFDALNKAGYLFQPTLTEGLRRDNRLYAYFNPFMAGARKMFWDQLNTALFSKGIDAWWMDATEPEIVSPPSAAAYTAHMPETGMGSGARMENGYALVNSMGVYQGQRSAAPDQRVFILTRSGFSGQQRYAALTWSGDVTSTWSALRKQIPAGLGFSISGLPYWTTDTGGYIMENRFASARNGENLDEWRELNNRWFQFSTFTPILRVHGQQQPREMYNLGDEASPVYQSELKFDKLRYALFPYIYSIAGAVTQQGYTMMRPLVMDFPDDLRVRNISDQYMFGPALLVNPVTAYRARGRAVYLPTSVARPAIWYDFWTGSRSTGGQTINAPAPYDASPLYVRAGSIIPTGPDVQYVGEKSADPLTIYIYAGVDGRFILYEDDGLTYNYEKGAFTQIPIRWNDAEKTITLGPRVGSFPAMLKDRDFNFVLVSLNHPTGFSFLPKPGKSISYHGQAADVKLE